MDATETRLPTYFISHGGGPWPWILDLMPGDFGPLTRSLEAIPREVGVTPKAVLVISGHWEERAFTVQTSANPPMLYDYGGFPEFTYHLRYDAPGSPAVAERVLELLDGAGLPTARNDRRGFDHGTFVPLHVMYPDAQVPVLQLSMQHGYDVDRHLAVGRALAPLRDEGVLIVGSGFTFHNLRMMFGGGGAEASAAFEAWLTDVLVHGPIDERTDQIRNWASAPAARISHPAEDHLVPLFVALGAVEGEAGVLTYHDSAFMETITSASYRFGAAVHELAPVLA